MSLPTLLAFDTSTEVMSVALVRAGALTASDSEGGAQASVRLIPEVMRLLSEAGVLLSQVDAVAFGHGPGAFTGLRTACSVAQGLAFGAGKPVLPVDSLLIVAEDAREQDGDAAADLWVAMDARMDEIYAARYQWVDGHWRVVREPGLFTQDALASVWRAEAPVAVAGSAIDAFGERLPLGQATVLRTTRSRAAALARVARQAWEQGGAVEAVRAQPLYLRDKVAQTTAERMAAKSTLRESL